MMSTSCKTPTQMPKRLDKFTAKQLFDDVDNFLFDFDGVICTYKTPIDGAVDCINRLKELGKKCYFVSNNSTKTRDHFTKLLNGIGIKDVSEDSVVCPTWILAGYLKSIGFKDKVYIIGTPSIAEELDKHGIKHIGGGSNLKEYPDPGEMDFETIQIDPEVKCVVVAFDYYFNVPKMIEATTYVLKNPGCIFLATHGDPRYTGINRRIQIPGTGSIANCIGTSVGYPPLVLGKPNTTMWKILSEQENLDAARTCMIGDNLFTDIAFATCSSLGRNLAVLTGVTNEKEINEFANDPSKAQHVPQYFTDSLDSFKKFINESF